MKDENKTKKLLIDELNELRKQNTDFKKSERKQDQIEQALREEYSFRSAIIKRAAEGLCVCHEVNEFPFVEFTVWNDRMTEITGYTMDDINRFGWYQSIYPDPDVQAQAMARMQRMWYGDDLNAEEWEITRSAGDKRLIAISTSLLKSDDGNAHVLALMHDITEQKLTEKALSESEKSFRAIFENANDAIYLIDPSSQKILNSNKKASEMSGYSFVELKNMNVSKLHPANERPKLPNKFHEISEKRSVEGIQGLHHLRKDGVLVPIEIHASIFTLEGKELNLSIVRDISERIKAEEELRNSEERLKILFEYAPDAYYLNDLKGNFLDGNIEAEKILGYKKDELIGESMFKLGILSSSQIPKAVALLAKNVLGKSTGPDEFVLNRKDGTEVLVEVRNYPVRLKDQTIVLGIARDITDRKKAEEELLKKEAHQALVLDSLPLAFYTAIPYGDYGGTWVSNQIKKISGFSAEQFMSDKGFWASRLHPEDCERIFSEFESLSKKNNIDVEYRWKSASGKYIWFLDRAVLIKDKKGEPKEIIGTWFDITDFKKTEEKIKASLEEKEVLLREIHHRVKNNMQIISSLLRLQSRSIKDKDALEKLKTSQDRIKSMALVHERLYKSQDLSQVHFSDYIVKLTTHLFSVYTDVANRVDLKLKIEKIYLDINRAIPCGQIINELVSNALKHAFPGERQGEINIKMMCDERGTYNLILKDTGIGFPENLDIYSTNTLGLQLVTDLVRQLKGNIKLLRKGGTIFKIEF